MEQERSCQKVNPSLMASFGVCFTVAETWDNQNMRDHSHFFERNKFLLNSIHLEVIPAPASWSRMLIPEMSQSPLGESTSQEGERVNLHSALYYLADKSIHYLPCRKKKSLKIWVRCIKKWNKSGEQVLGNANIETHVVKKKRFKIRPKANNLLAGAVKSGLSLRDCTKMESKENLNISDLNKVTCQWNRNRQFEWKEGNSCRLGARKVIRRIATEPVSCHNQEVKAHCREAIMF